MLTLAATQADAAPSFFGMDDLATAPNAAALLQALQSRHAAELVFTRCGTMMVAINPHRPLPHLFSRKEEQKHVHALGRQLPPHVYELGARALSAVACEGECQCLTLVGPSGSGKSFLARRLVQQLAAGSASGSAIEEPLLRGCGLLDLFGSAHMLPPGTGPGSGTGHAASAFCRACVLYYGADGRVTGAKVHTLLLTRGALLPADLPPAGSLSISPPTPIPTPEKKQRWPLGGSGSGSAAASGGLLLPTTRVGGARSLRAVLGAEGVVASELGLSALGSSRLLPEAEPGGEAASSAAYKEACGAMELLGLSAEQRAAVWRAVAAVLHLGCIQPHHSMATEGTAADAEPTAPDDQRGPPEALAHAARLLGCSSDALWRALAGSGRGGSGSSSGGGVAVPGLVLVARAEALARHICARALEWLGDQVNACLSTVLARRASTTGAASPRADNLDLSQLSYLAVLEAPPPAPPLDGTSSASGGGGWWAASSGACRDADVDGLLQGYAAEAVYERICDGLYSALVEQPKQDAITSYTAPPLPGEHCRALLTLLGAPGGVLPTLIEHEAQHAAATPQQASEIEKCCMRALAARVTKAAHTPGGQSTRLHGAGFVLTHFHGEVAYDSSKLASGLRRLAEPSEAVLLCLQASTVPTVRGMFSTPRGATRSRRGSGGGSASVVGGCASRLGGLIELLSGASAAHTTLCLLPNATGQRAAFDSRMVTRQLDGFGIPKLSAAMAHGFAERMSVRRFVGRYRCLAPINSRKMHQTFLLVGGSSPEEVRQGCEALLATLPMRQGDFALGRTCVFLRTAQLAQLESARAVRILSATGPIAAAARGLRVRACFSRVRSKAGSATRFGLEWAAVRAALAPAVGARPTVQPGTSSRAPPREALAAREAISSAAPPLPVRSASAPVGVEGSSAAAPSASDSGVESRPEVIARAVELGMDVTDDRKYFWMAAEALDAQLPDGWIEKRDALGQSYYLHTETNQSSREHPLNEQYRKSFFARKLQEVGYRRLMLSRITSTHLYDALAEMPEDICRKMEALFEQHDRDKDGVVSLPEFAVLSDEAAARQGVRPMAPSKLRAIFVAADINNDKVVDFNEFCYAQLRKRKAKQSRSRRSSPANSVAGSVAGDDTPRSEPNYTPRTWPTPPMTPRDPLDSPSTMSVASTESQLSARSHYSDDGRHSVGRSAHSGHSSAGGQNAFAELLNGLLGGGPSFGGTSTSRSGGSDDASPAANRELTLSSMWPAPLPTDAVSQYVGGSPAARAHAAASPALGGTAAALDPMGAMKAMLGGGGAKGLPSQLNPNHSALVPHTSSPAAAGGSEDAIWGALILEEGGEGGAPSRTVLRGAAHMIGRSKACRTVITNARVSGQHAVLFRTTGQVLLEDRSRFGTFLNGELIGKGGSAPVRSGDRVALLAPMKPEGIVFRIELAPGQPQSATGGPTAGTPATPADPPVPSALPARSSPYHLPPAGRHRGSAASVASSEAPTEWPTEWDAREPNPNPMSLGPAPPSQYVMAPPHAPPICAQQQQQQRQGTMMPPPAPFPPPMGAAAAAYAPSRAPPMCPPPMCARGGSPGTHAIPPMAPPPGAPPPGVLPVRPPLPTTPPQVSVPHAAAPSVTPPEIPPLGMPAREATGVGAPNARIDISQEEPWQSLQRLQVEALAGVDVSDPQNAKDGAGRKQGLATRMMRSLSFKMKRSPAKSPRGDSARDGRSPRDGASTPCSPAGSPRSQPSYSREASPRGAGATLVSIRTQDDAPPPGANSSFKMPQWDGGTTKVLDPNEARVRGPRAEAPAPSTPSNAGGKAARPAGDFDAAYEDAANVAAAELMRRATGRGEKFSANVGQADFLAAVTLMASELRLNLDAAGIEQLFHAVSGGGRSVQFEDFIEAPSTKYYLQQIAGVGHGDVEA